MMHNFTNVYPLPWTLRHFGKLDCILSANGLRLCSVSRADTERKRAAMLYLIQCANTMPYIFELLNDMGAVGTVDEITDRLDDGAQLALGGDDTTC